MGSSCLKRISGTGKVSKTICDLMEELGILKGLPESNQLSLFDF